MSQDKKEEQPGYAARAKGYYNGQYESWMPWIEDKYLSWFTKDNKASYATKQSLDKSKVTGVDQIDTLQDGVHGVVSGQVGKGGLLQPIGDMASKEGINRAERGGKDDKGKITPGGAGDSYLNQAKGGVTSGAGAVGDGAKSGAGALSGGAKSAGGWAGSWVGGGKKNEGGEQAKK